MFDAAPPLSPHRVIDELSRLRTDLHRLGVRRLALFGSTARNQTSQHSDLDFLVVLQNDRFDTYMDVKEFLEATFQRPVDLVVRSALKPALQARVLAEAIDVPGL